MEENHTSTKDDNEVVETVEANKPNLISHLRQLIQENVSNFFPNIFKINYYGQYKAVRTNSASV